MTRLHSSRRGVSLFRQIAVLSVCSFVLHFMWEMIQCIPFFIHLAEPPTIPGMIRASLGDVVLTLTAFVVVWALTQDRNWILKIWGWKTWAGLVGSALVLSISIEVWALEVNRWKYTELNPTLPYLGVSVVPIFQLLLLFPLSFWLTRKLVTPKKDSEFLSQKRDFIRITK